MTFPAEDIASCDASIDPCNASFTIERLEEIKELFRIIQKKKQIENRLIKKKINFEA